MRHFAFFVLCFSIPGIVMAQDDFSHVKTKVGQTVYVTDAETGVVVKGVVTELSAAVIRVGAHEFTPHPGLKIERSGDPVWDGAALGFGVGMAIGAAGGIDESCIGRTKKECIWNGGVSMGLIGALIDWMHEGRTTIYPSRSVSTARTARLVPIVEPRRRALALRLGF